MRTERKSNVELLRILCMFMLVVHHFLAHSQLWALPVCANKVIVSILLPVGKICFNCFVAISCWYFVKSKFKATRFVKVWLEVLFSNVVFTVLTIVLQGESVIANGSSVFGAFFPIIGNSHGYACAYLAFYLLIPFLKKIQEDLNKKQTVILLCVLGGTQVLVPIMGQLISYTQPVQSEFLLFVFVYFVAYYLQKWPIRIANSKMLQLVLLVLIVVMIVGTNIATMYSNSSVFGFIQAICSSEYSVFNIMAGMLLFSLVSHIDIPKSKIINAVASTTFGILLFHDHNYFRSIVWRLFIDIFEWKTLNPIIFITMVVIISMCIFCIGMTIDTFRQICVESWLMRVPIVKKVIVYLDNAFESQKNMETDEI